MYTRLYKCKFIYIHGQPDHSLQYRVKNKYTISDNILTIGNYKISPPPLECIPPLPLILPITTTISPEQHATAQNPEKPAPYPPGNLPPPSHWPPQTLQPAPLTHKNA